MGWPGSDNQVQCKKHPKHRQSPGVCSVCLRERLSRLSSAKTSSTTTATSYIISFSLSDSSYSSSYSSPIHHHFGSSNTKSGPVAFLASTGKDGLQRSRSMAFAWARKRVEESAGIGANRKKKGGFWSRLLGSSSSMSKRKKDPSMQYSKTMKETRVTRLV